MSEVKIFKLSSGQEVIAKVLDNGDSSSVLVESPVTLQPMRGPDGGLNVGMIPFSFGAKNGAQVVLQRSGILATLTADPDIESHYLSAISGLVLPEGSTSAGPKITLT